MSPFSDTSSPFLRLPPPLTRSIVLFFPKEKLQLALIEVHDDEVIHAPAAGRRLGVVLGSRVAFLLEASDSLF